MHPKKLPELSWSIFHARELDMRYARRIVREAPRFGVDSLELCGGCHGHLQGLEGGIFYQAYPGAVSKAQATAVRTNTERLRAIGDMAHGAGLPLYYWHREVCVPRQLLKLEPALLDDRGEFDLLGESYRRLLENKLAEFFENVPEVDGIVLTLTEADYSVIHNSRPELYPAAKVVERLLRVFSRMHRKLGKRFILRSFGSIEQDHVDLFAGVRAAKGETFEVETKVTPFDWNPHLPLNPWLGPLGNRKFSVEMDAMGEYFGPGVLASPCPDEMLRYLRYAFSRKVDRIALRIDRCGASALGNIQEVNLEAVSRGLRSAKAMAAEAWESWGENWKAGACLPSVARIMKRNFEVVKLSRYIDGNLIFHTFPISPSMEFLKLGGIFALFQPGVSLSRQRDMWSIRSERRAPSAEKLILEKKKAVDLARQLLVDFGKVEAGINPRTAREIRRWLENGLEAAVLFLEFCETIQAYFRDLNAGSLRGEAFLKQAGRTMRICQKCKDSAVIETHAKPLISMILALKKEYRVESRALSRWKSQRDIVDFVICGGLLHECRVRRLLHGNGSRIARGRQERAVGNRAFPNGFLEYELRVVPGPACLVIQVARETAGRLLVEIGRSPGKIVEVPGNGKVRIPTFVRSRQKKIRIRILRGDSSYPWIHAVAVRRDQMSQCVPAM